MRKDPMPKIISLLSVVVFIADRILKWYVLGMTTPYEAGFFAFGRFINPSLFFFPAWPWISWMALTVLIAILVFWIWNFIGNCPPAAGPPREEKLEIGNSLRHPLVPILLGGGSNVFDRFVYGGVIDYVEIFGLATINLADILILLGLILLIRNSYDKRS